MKFNVFSKGIERLLMVLLCVFSISFVSCSDDDDEENGAYGKTDYIEVTVNGKTYKEFVPNFLYVCGESETDGLSISFSTVDCFAKHHFMSVYGLVHPTYFKDFVNAKPGTYDVVQKIDDNVNLFDFCIDYDRSDDDKYYESVSGTNFVKSVTPQKENDAVIVEGEFDANLEEMNSSKPLKMKGKYKITIFCY